MISHTSSAGFGMVSGVNSAHVSRDDVAFSQEG
jgi:hypothetical protein